jgi:hypothetical protein
MRASDTMVQTVETIIGLPVRTVRWRIDPGDSSKASQEAAALLDENLLRGNGMTHGFDDLVRKILIAPMIGWQCFAKWHKEDRGYIKFDTFLDIHPQTLKAWVTGEGGRIVGMTMTGNDAEGKVREETIPPESLMRATYREEWGNPEGFPLCRVQYPNWYIKRTLLLMLNIGMEREWVGTPKGKYPKGTSKEDRDAWLDALKRLTTTANGAIVFEDGYELDTYIGHAKTDAAMEYLRYLDDGIAKVALASFINLVGSGQGSRALSTDQSTFFLQCEQALARWVCEIINQQAIRQLVLFNFPGLPDAAMPRLNHSHISTVLQPVALGHALAALVNKQLLTPDFDVENSVREMLNLPMIPEDQRNTWRPMQDPAPPAQTLPGTRKQAEAFPPLLQGEGPGVRSRGSALQGATPSPSAVCCSQSTVHSPQSTSVLAETSPDDFADLPVREQFRAQLPQIKADLDAGQATFIAGGSAILDRSLDWMELQVAALADEAAGLAPLQRGTVHLKLSELDLPHRGEYEDWLRGMMLEMARAGIAQVQESRRPPDEDVPEVVISNELRSFCRAKARVTADLHFEQLRAAAVYRAQEDLEGKLGRDQVRFNVRQVLRDQASARLGGGMLDILRQVADQVASVTLV